MGILKKILEEYPTVNNLDEQMRVICDKIQAEENIKFSNPSSAPTGPNIFLTTQLGNETTYQSIRYCCIERESVGEYIISAWEYTKRSDKHIRFRSWEITANKVDAILEAFAKKINFLNGK